MDLGFGGLIEEIEKRFGKFPTTFLLGLLFVGICLWTFNQSVLLFAETARLAATGNTGDFILAVLYRVGFWVVLMGLGLGFIHLRVKKFLTEASEANARLEDLGKEVRDNIKDVEAGRAEIKEAWVQYENRAAEWEAVRNDLEGRINAAENLLKEKGASGPTHGDPDRKP